MIATEISIWSKNYILLSYFSDYEVKLRKWNNLPWIWINLHSQAFMSQIKCPCNMYWQWKENGASKRSDLRLNDVLKSSLWTEEEDENLDTKTFLLLLFYQFQGRALPDSSSPGLMRWYRSIFLGQICSGHICFWECFMYPGHWI